MNRIPHVIRAEHRGGFRIHIVFDDGLSKTLDFWRWLNGPVFEPLKDAAFFQLFFIDAGTVCWPNGADIDPVTLYDAREEGAAT